MEIESNGNWHNTEVELFLLRPQDVGVHYVNWLNDNRVNRYLESRFKHHTLEQTRDFVEQCLRDPLILFLGIRAKKYHSKHIGNVKLGPINPHHGLGEVGILIGEPDLWGKGLSTNALTLLVKIAESQLSLRKLTAGCYASNIGSRRAFLKAGFEVEGVRKDHFILDGHSEDLVLLARWLHPHR